VRIRRRSARAPSRYVAVAERVLYDNGVQVQRWREDSEGYAYLLRGLRVIDAPYPHTAAALSVLMHEVAHHALGHTTEPEWATARRELEEEWEAWGYAFACLASLGLNIPREVCRRVAASMAERLAAALTEGLTVVPPRFQPFEAAARAILAAPPVPRYNDTGGHASGSPTHPVECQPP
jgi:hypothetical protein